VSREIGAIHRVLNFYQFIIFCYNKFHSVYGLIDAYIKVPAQFVIKYFLWD